ncbi:hypothetical protein PMSD_20480 [Paenibacillus macquariensis subsp. defensor]|nr:hypothetical protein PMSD_20480 [Paenibacillus macquariensis subsp. defensor]
MNNVHLSIDKVSVEYHGVTVNFYNQLALSFRDWFDIKSTIRHKGLYTIGIWQWMTLIFTCGINRGGRRNQGSTRSN